VTDGQKPQDPFTMLSEASSGLHEMFASLIESGFTEWQACRVIGVMLAESGRQS
jgi:hypothetical protein